MLKKFWENIKNKDLVIIVALLCLNILPRLVYIFNAGFFVDGDEAILGTAIRDFYYNHHFSLFLSGQNYGFIFPELLAASAVSFFIGVNMFSLKISILLFWLANIVILYLIGKKIFVGRRWATLAVLLASFTPVWYDWATKARFGYVSSLLMSNIVILLALSKKSVVRIITISLFLLLIYYSQPLYLIVTVPFLLSYFLKDFKFKETTIFIFSSLALWLTSHTLLLYFNFNYQLQNKLGLGEISRNIKNIFRDYSVAYSGRFFDNLALKEFSSALVVSWIFIGLLLIAIIYNFYLIFRKKIEKINILFLSSVILYGLFMLFYNGPEYHYRYLLPFFVPSIFLIVLTAEQWPWRPMKSWVFILLVIFSASSLICGMLAYEDVFPKLNDDYTEIERIENLGEFLGAHDVKGVYALDWLISQHLDYFVPELTARYQEFNPGRPQDSGIVDGYQRDNESALVGFWYQMPLFLSLYKLEDIYVVNNRYIVHLYPQQDDLLKLHFKLTE